MLLCFITLLTECNLYELYKKNGDKLRRLLADGCYVPCFEKLRKYRTTFYYFQILFLFF